MTATKNDCSGVSFIDATVDAAALGANDTTDETVTVAGIHANDLILQVIPPADIDDKVIVSHAYVSAANTVIVRIGNVGAGTPNPASATWRFVFCRR